MKTDDADKLLDAGLSLVDKISQLLEGVRDNIYVNEYIMTMFPNVVEDKKEPKKSDRLAKKRREYDATYAGVEYILAGNAGSAANVVTVDAELLGVRTIFNTVAIYGFSQAAPGKRPCGCHIRPLCANCQHCAADRLGGSGIRHGCGKAEKWGRSRTL